MNNLEKRLLEIKRNSFFQKAKTQIEIHQKIVILGHIRPDGDCIGSQIGLYYSLKQKYPTKEIFFPFARQSYSNFLLPKDYKNEINEEILEDTLIIVVDLNTLERLPIKILANNFIIQIDHHPQEQTVNFAHLSWVDEQAPSCAELIYLFLKTLNFNISKQTATALLLGIITDSGHFRYPGVNSLTFRIAAALIDLGAELQNIYQNLSKTMFDLKMKTYCLNNLVQEQGLTYFFFRPEDKVNMPEIEKAENPFAAPLELFSFVQGISVWAFFIQMNKSDDIKVRLRCSKDFNVEKIARKYGGGGHKNASGIQIKDWLTVSEIITDLKKLIKKIK